MNERIRQLAEQARYYVANAIELGFPQDQIDDIRDEKFAELIVKECIDYCGENLSKTVGGALKIHFGVEE